MTDAEIYNMLSKVQPESFKQWEKLSTCMKILLADDDPEYVEDYMENLTVDDVLEKRVSEVYSKYLEWCELNYINDISSTKRFNKYLSYKFGVTTKAVNGKRIYIK